MSGVNLSRRPFVNRRPVLRLAILLWLVGVVLLAVNVKLFGGHFQGSASLRQRLVSVDVEVREAQQELGLLGGEVDKVNLSQQNGRTVFLNSLIDYRRFPWSALFDDLEEVLPLDVRLLSVSPAVRLVVEPEKPRRRSNRRRSASRNAAPPPEKPKESARSDEVQLHLSGVARNEDAMLEFVDVLYASSSFRNPFLPGESTGPDGTVSFSVDVLYLTRRSSSAEEESAEGVESVVAEESLVAEEGGAAQQDADEEPSVTASGVEQSEAAPGETAGSGAAGLETSGLEAAGLKPTDLEPEESRATAEAAPSAPGTVERTRRSSSRGASGSSRPRRSQEPLVGGAPPADEAPPGSAPVEVTEPFPGADPSFPQPPASATPQLRSGSLPGALTSVSATWGALA